MKKSACRLIVGYGETIAVERPEACYHEIDRGNYWWNEFAPKRAAQALSVVTGKRTKSLAVQ